ncbi:hypothetical protein OG389_05645 [Streptomyces sp. NBC_00435]|uniref:hypothetical protein n=1 Tax=Streptomyces sp. NBC_00435 TaxID=2903649 RepID=UPI002E2446A5
MLVGLGAADRGGGARQAAAGWPPAPLSARAALLAAVINAGPALRDVHVRAVLTVLVRADRPRDGFQRAERGKPGA